MDSLYIALLFFRIFWSRGTGYVFGSSLKVCLITSQWRQHRVFANEYTQSIYSILEIFFKIFLLLTITKGIYKEIYLLKVLQPFKLFSGVKFGAIKIQNPVKKKSYSLSRSDQKKKIQKLKFRTLLYVTYLHKNVFCRPAGKLLWLLLELSARGCIH